MTERRSQAAPVITQEALVGQVIKKLREEREPQFSQADMANKVGVSQPYWSKVEQGMANPSLKLLEQTAAVLRMNYSEFHAVVEQARRLAEQKGVTVKYREEIAAESDWVPLLGAAAIGALIAILLTRS